MTKRKRDAHSNKGDSPRPKRDSKSQEVHDDDEDGIEAVSQDHNETADTQLLNQDEVDLEPTPNGGAEDEMEQDHPEEEDFDDDDEEEEDQGGPEGWKKIAGMIQNIRMRNFMCHSEFTYTPIDRLNFLSGVNGSGKSAVLAAITFALGGSARMSNRGSANRNFIRTNQASANVEISLYNRGENAYKPKVYGKSLIVSRTVHMSGGGSYKLKNETGKVVADKRVKEELDRVLSCYNIQVDNPIALLNQDTAKTLLFKCHPDKLYLFFMRATQLDDCHQYYNEAAIDKNKADYTLERKVKQAYEMKAEKVEWEKKYQFYQKLEEKKERLNDVKKELAYATLDTLNEEVDDKKGKVGLASNKISSCQEKIDQEIDDKNALKHQKDAVEAEIQSITEVAVAYENDLNELRLNARNVRSEAKKLDSEEGELARLRDGKNRSLKSIEKAIDKIRNTGEDHYEVEAKKRRDQMAELEAKREEMEAKWNSTQNHAKNLEFSATTTGQTDNDLRGQIRQAKTELARHQRERKNVVSQGDNRLILFGDKMPQFVNEIKRQENMFKVPPIGPLGLGIKLKADVSKDEATLIEHELGKLLGGFIVDNFNDRRALDRIARQYKMNITIITSKFCQNRHDISGGRVQTRDFPAIIDLLDIENPNVSNCLIDQKHIEQVLIMRRDAEAQEVLKSVRTVPPNCQYALTCDFNQFYPAPMYRSYAMNPNQRRGNVLQASMTEHIEAIQKEMDIVQMTVDNLNKELEVNQEKHRSHEDELKSAKKICNGLKTKIQTLVSDIWHIKKKDEAEKPPDIYALEEDLEKVQEEIAKFDKDIEKHEERKSEAKEKVEEAEEKLKIRQDEVQSHVSKSAPLNDKLARIEEAIEKKERLRKSLVDKLKKYENFKEEFEKELTAFRVRLATQLGIAEEWGGDPVKTNRPPRVIQKEVRSLEEGFRRQEQVREPRDVVQRQYRDYSIAYAKIKDSINEVAETVAYLGKMLKRRKKSFDVIRGAMCRRVKLSFVERLSARNYVGTLIFNHRKTKENPQKTLELVVCPEGGDQLQRRSMKSLSGGEKSYSTVSLVLALWECIQPPFRILDEFDVFMDMVNRRIALDQMIAYARDRRQFQYIFLTPLTMNSVEASKDVNIVYLKKSEG